MGTATAISKRFGVLLSHILGGLEANQRVAAERLGVHVCMLNAILHGRQRVSQRLLANKRWRDVLEKYYPGGWKQHSAAFERCAARLRVSRGYCSSEPRNKGGFGYVLWLILGGEGMDLMKASEQLNIDHTYLSAIIHGRMRTSQQTVNKREWRRGLMEHYAEGWRQHADEFEKYAAALPVGAGRPKMSA